jgi:ankyrin repeat protein
VRAANPAQLRHLDTLKYLISQHHLPLDTPDIAGWTALSHAAMAPIQQTPLLKALLDGRAKANHQSRLGDCPLLGAIQQGNWQEVDLLLSYGADLDVTEADGHSPRSFYAGCGNAQVVQVVNKHIQRRTAPPANTTLVSASFSVMSPIQVGVNRG